MTHPGLGRTSRKVESAFRVSGTIEIGSILLTWVMDACGQMNHCFHLLECRRPVRISADRTDQKIVGIVARNTDRPAHSPTSANKLRCQMATDETIRSCH